MRTTFSLRFRLRQRLTNLRSIPRSISELQRMMSASCNSVRYLSRVAYCSSGATSSSIPPATHYQDTTNVGDGNVVNASYADLSRLSTEARKRLAVESDLEEETRLDVISDLDGLSAQLQKPRPNLTVVRALWESVKVIGIVGSAAEILEKAAHLISPLLQ
jgi:hypothetical protein